MKIGLIFLCLMGILLADGCSNVMCEEAPGNSTGNIKGTKSWNLSHKGVALLEHLEGFRSTVYASPNGARTIGYGHEIKPHEHITYVSREEAEDMLYKDVREIERFLTREGFTWMDPDKCDALVVFIYNIGLGRFRRSRVYACLLEGKREDAVRHWMMYDKYKDPTTGKEVVSRGLRHRRMHEVAMFLGRSV